MENFVPIINYRVFRDAILEIKEGGNWEVNKLIQNKFEKLTHEEFFEHFLKLCKKYDIAYHYFVDENVADGKYNIVVTFDKYDSYQMSYKDKNKEVGNELGYALRKSVEVKIRNEIFFKKNLEG